MRKLIIPLSITAFAAIAVAAWMFSLNAELWLQCIGAGAITIIILGGRRAHIVLLWICGLAWLQVLGDVLLADIDGENMKVVLLGSYHVMAIQYSLVALIVMALGMRLAIELGRRLFRRGKQITFEMTGGTPLRFQRLLACYFISWAIMPALSIVGQAVPGLAQPVYVIGFVRFAFLYLIALQVFEKNRNYQWLVLIGVFEIALGLTSYFAAFTGPIFIIIFAFITSGRRVNIQAALYGTVLFSCLFWLMLIWTAVKPEFRATYGERGITENLAWMTDRILYQDIDYKDAMHNLVARIGYTTLYGKILARSDAGVVPNLDLYEGAILQILKPRLFFPEKAALNDSVLTTALTGIHINEQTSIGVGYIAEAHADFGFPVMLIPIGLIGAMLGLMLMYFLTRPVPITMRHAVAIATLFTQFSIAANIDKALGGCVMAFLGISLLLKFVYPLFGAWLAAPRPGRTVQILPSTGNVPT